MRHPPRRPPSPEVMTMVGAGIIAVLFGLLFMVISGT
jgi:hypothetical protein